MKKLFVLLMTVTVSAMLLAGCYGPFQLTKKVYNWNGSLENRWGREAMFLVLNIIPVYGFAALADSVFFNLIDFWGGENPLPTSAVPRSKMISQGDRQAVVTLSDADAKVRVDLFDHYRPQTWLTVERTPVGAVARDARGAVVMTARTIADGSVLVERADGRQIALRAPEAK